MLLIDRAVFGNSKRKNQKSTLGELEALTGFLMSILLTFNHPAVTGKKVSVLEGWLQVGTNLDQGTRDAQ
jgi:hypothetical protein